MRVSIECDKNTIVLFLLKIVMRITILHTVGVKGAENVISCLVLYHGEFRVDPVKKSMDSII